MSFIHETAIIQDSQLSEVKIFRNGVITASILKDGCSIGDDTTIERCTLENNVIINRRSYVNDSTIGAYTYAGINLTMNFTHIGRFCSIGRNVDIGGFDHDYHMLTTMPHFRFNQMNRQGGKITEKLEHSFCEIGNDVWIAAGAQILHKAKIGDGAVIGAGAVVTKDIPPYAIAVGIPAKVIGYRCDPALIDELLKLKWWDWPINKILENADYLMDNEISAQSIKHLQQIKDSL